MESCRSHPTRCVRVNTTVFAMFPVIDRHAIIGVHAGDLILSDDEANTISSHIVFSSARTDSRDSHFDPRAVKVTIGKHFKTHFT